MADLAHISTVYYSLLEQGRAGRPSTTVIDSLATALRMSDRQRAHLHALAAATSDQTPVSTFADPQILELVRHLHPYPAYLLDHRLTMLAANDNARSIWADLPATPWPGSNLVWWMLLDPVARVTFPDWEGEATGLLARFRVQADRHVDDPILGELVGKLLTASSLARSVWAQAKVAPIDSGTKQLIHPIHGVVTYERTVLQPTRRSDLFIVMYSRPQIDHPTARPPQADQASGRG